MEVATNKAVDKEVDISKVEVRLRTILRIKLYCIL